MARLDGLATVLDFLNGLQPKIAAQIAKKVLALISALQLELPLIVMLSVAIPSPQSQFWRLSKAGISANAKIKYTSYLLRLPLLRC